MHELQQMKPIGKTIPKKESVAILDRLRYAPSIREVDIFRRAFIFRAHKIGVNHSDIAAMTGISRQRVAQVIYNIKPTLLDLTEPVDTNLLMGDYRVVHAVTNICRKVQVRERWEESEQFRYAMMRLVGYTL